MNRNSLWSIRLGFSNQQAAAIEKMGISKFLDASFKTNLDNSLPEFLKESPKTLAELREKRQKLKNLAPDKKKEILKKEFTVSNEMKSWWINKMIHNDYPLQEKMTLMLHNHFVATYQKVKVNHWIFQHNQLLRKNAFGNFKDMTKTIVKSNAMVRYLDNVDNRKDKINENLSRELLELFTLGIGNYTEEDIKNGAKALAGLSLGENEAIYRKFQEDNSEITYLGKTGRFKADDIVDIIFEQKNIPYHFTRKILQWFIYDHPEETLVTYYGDYFRTVNFEIRPLLHKIFTEEFEKNNAGSKIKNPLEYSLQLLSELNINQKNNKPLVLFLKSQGMDLFNQPNVKGWEGGNSWLTSQIYLQRNNIADLYCNGKALINQRSLATMSEDNMKMSSIGNIAIHLEWKIGSNKQIIKELSERLLFEVNEENQDDFKNILKYDFDPNAPNANQAVLRLFNAMVKLPEFQLI
jgi:uncharacterized protein (DUF1800 family)